MTKQSFTVKTPGKLMVAGEFAVLEAHHHLITMAVDRFVYVTVENSAENRLNLTDFNLNNLEWSFTGENVETTCNDERLSFVKEAINVTYTYLREKNYRLKPCSITIKSELADESGIKYGLGSSAAVVTAVVTALLHKQLGEEADKMLTFKLASLAHVIVQGNGSGADIAASTFGGMVLYTSFQAEWLLNKYEECESISVLVEDAWTYLSIKQLDFPEDFYIKIGWTGSPASTGSLVSDVKKLKVANRTQYDTFLQKSEESVQKIAQSIALQRFTPFKEAIEKNRQALAQLGRDAAVNIETEKLNLLSRIAREYDGAGKLSGAGGGDCGIAFLSSLNESKKLTAEWEKHDIKPLDLKLEKKGSHII